MIDLKNKQRDVISSRNILPLNKREWLIKLNLKLSGRVIDLYKALMIAEQQIEDLLNKQPTPMKWEMETIDRYYYLSGRNYTTYVECTYWYKSDTLERKETKRTTSILDSDKHKLPDWAKNIIDRRKQLEYDYL